ncbi:hypothetical protein Micbo1qcDRAFT_223805 [Microdochium bolleyi]|uniref:MARVEL domain-containing protein n=1 Tax=Microdochium bolleyi TaxID=196109 RepID=A0A136J377_9PEZI|nr:hypothetical protein Micbo1qcDRAFT_223805 [Microdochium bolleyi]
MSGYQRPLPYNKSGSAPGGAAITSQAAPPPINRGWYIAKIVLGSLSLALSIVILAISAAAWARTRGWLREFAWTAPIAILAICWHTAEFVTLCARRGGGSPVSSGPRRRHGIHPGGHIGVNIVCWFGFMGIVAVDAYNAFTLHVLRDEDSFRGQYGYYPTDLRGQTDFLVSDTYWAMTLASVGIAAALAIIHFALFVRACVETHHRNSAARSVQVVYVPQPVYYQQNGTGHGTGGYLHVPQQGHLRQ